MYLTTLEAVPNMIVTEHYGLVSGSSVRAKNMIIDIMADIKNAFGGEIHSYGDLLRETREKALNEMVEQAKSMGANGILNIRYETSNIAAGAAEVYVYGTAVKLE